MHRRAADAAPGMPSNRHEDHRQSTLRAPDPARPRGEREGRAAHHQGDRRVAGHLGEVHQPHRGAVAARGARGDRARREGRAAARAVPEESHAAGRRDGDGRPALARALPRAAGRLQAAGPLRGGKGLGRRERRARGGSAPHDARRRRRRPAPALPARARRAGLLHLAPDGLRWKSGAGRGRLPRRSRGTDRGTKRRNRP